MDTQFESIEEFPENSHRIVSLILSDTFDDAFDVNKLNAIEYSVLITMAMTVLGMVLEDFSRAKIGASVFDEYRYDERHKYFRQFFTLNTHAKTNFLKLVDKVIDEYTASHESWGSENELYLHVKKVIVSIRAAVNKFQEIIQKHS